MIFPLNVLGGSWVLASSMSIAATLLVCLQPYLELPKSRKLLGGTGDSK